MFRVGKVFGIIPAAHRFRRSDPGDGVAEEREYLLGTDDDELARLGFQHQVWAADAVAE